MAILHSDNNHTYLCIFTSSGSPNMWYGHTCPIGCYGPGAIGLGKTKKEVFNIVEKTIKKKVYT